MHSDSMIQYDVVNIIQFEYFMSLRAVIGKIWGGEGILCGGSKGLLYSQNTSRTLVGIIIGITKSYFILTLIRSGSSIQNSELGNLFQPRWPFIAP